MSTKREWSSLIIKTLLRCLIGAILAFALLKLIGVI